MKQTPLTFLVWRTILFWSLSYVWVAVRGGSPDFPAFRFVPWKYLNPDVKQWAEEKLQYTESSWDIPGTLDVEYRSMDMLETDVAKNLHILGFRSHYSWDCYIAHYEDWTWNEMESAHLTESLVTLGYTRESWNKDTKPDTMRKYWVDLTIEEQLAANELCYNAGSWDSRPLQEWTIAIDNSQLVAPIIRYTKWEDLSFDAKLAATRLYYNATSWNQFNTNEIEWKSYSQLIENIPNISSTLQEIGLDGLTYDCYINHYSDYDFDDLNTLGLDDYFRTLGWTEESWYGEAPLPKSEYTTWAGLLEVQKVAARKLCYNEVSWDGKSLDEWSFSPSNPCGFEAETCYGKPEHLKICASRPKTTGFGMLSVDRCYREPTVEYLFEKYPASYCGACRVHDQNASSIPTCEDYICGIDEHWVCARRQQTGSGIMRESQVCVSPMLRNRVFRKYPLSSCGSC